MYKALDVAKYFLSKADEDAGDLISNLKLQKLLYYAQGYHLAIFGEPLFEETIEAWTHGPVVPVVYQHYKHHEKNGIPAPDDVPEMPDETREFLDETYAVLGQFSAWKLRNSTHDEPPWKDTNPSDVISLESMREYFKTQVK